MVSPLYTDSALKSQGPRFVGLFGVADEQALSLCGLWRAVRGSHLRARGFDPLWLEGSPEAKPSSCLRPLGPLLPTMPCGAFAHGYRTRSRCVPSLSPPDLIIPRFKLISLFMGTDRRTQPLAEAMANLSAQGATDGRSVSSTSGACPPEAPGAVFAAGRAGQRVCLRILPSRRAKRARRGVGRSPISYLYANE